MTVSGKQHFGRFHENVKQFDVTGKTLLIPEMAPFASRLLAASFRAVGVNALVMETYKGWPSERNLLPARSASPAR